MDLGIQPRHDIAALITLKQFPRRTKGVRHRFVCGVPRAQQGPGLPRTLLTWQTPVESPATTTHEPSLSYGQEIQTPRPVRTHSELCAGLGHVIYDALLLALSLQVWRDRGTFDGRVTGTDFNRERQIALELMVVKCRTFDDFLMSNIKFEKDMVASEFTYVPSGRYTELLHSFRML